MTNAWQTIELGKVMQLEIDAVPVDSQPEFQMAGVYSFARGLFKRETLPNTQTTYKFFHRLHKDMFVISVPKGWEGALARVTEDFDGMFLSPVFPTFRANPKIIDIRYFEWYCRQSKIWDELRRKSRGIGARRESISAEKFLSLEIPLPPLDEQRRIVERVETLAIRITKAQFLRSDAFEETWLFKSSLLKMACEGQLGLHGALDEPAEITLHRLGQSPISNSDLPSLPTKWCWAYLENVCKVISGYSFKSEDFTESGIPVIKIGNIGYQEFLWVSQEYLPESLYQSKSDFVVEPQTILIALTRPITSDTVKVCKYPKDAKIGLLNQRVAMLKPFDCLSGEYLLYYMQSIQFKELIKRSISESLQPNLSPNSLKRFPIPVPPLDEQRRIVAYLDSVQARLASLRELQSATGEELSALLPSVLDRAFKGEL